MGNTISPEFTPVASTVGGLLIGLSAAGLLHGAGEIMGFTNVIGGACFSDLPHRALLNCDNGWRFSFLASFFVATLLIIRFTDMLPVGYFDESTTVPWWLVAISGVLAGFGTKMAKGCTSGHGICGMGRLSKRSFVAVATFMGTAFLSATLCSPVFPRLEGITHLSEPTILEPSVVIQGIGIGLTAMFAAAGIVSIWWQIQSVQGAAQLTGEVANNDASAYKSADGARDSTTSSAIQNGFSDDDEGGLENSREYEKITKKVVILKNLASIAVAPVFSIGLIIGGMTKQSKIVGFFDLTGFARGAFDPSLMLLFVGGILVSFVGYQFVHDDSVTKIVDIVGEKRTRRQSAIGTGFHIPQSTRIDRGLVIGSAMFGVSMGIAGFCPSPSLIMLLGGYFDATAIWLPLYGTGCLLQLLIFRGQQYECEDCDAATPAADAEASGVQCQSQSGEIPVV